MQHREEIRGLLKFEKSTSHKTMTGLQGVLRSQLGPKVLGDTLVVDRTRDSKPEFYANFLITWTFSLGERENRDHGAWRVTGYEPVFFSCWATLLIPGPNLVELLKQEKLIKLLTISCLAE